nr:uncharacterized protein LOC123771605 [Procambarus clarkii]
MVVRAGVLPPVVVLVLYVVEVGLVVACAALHLRRGTDASTLYGGLTLAIFCLAGWVTNGFNFYRHERRRMSQISRLKWSWKVFALVLPSQALLGWIVRWIRTPSSYTNGYRVVTLRLFYCTTGSLVQAVFQAYVIVALWWDASVDPADFTVMVTAAVFLALAAVLGVCSFIRTQYFEEEHETPPMKHFLFVVISVTLNMCGRIASMAMVAAVVSWTWMVAGIAAPIVFNYGFCLYITDPLHGKSKVRRFARCFMPLPIAMLYSLSVSPKKITTVVTTCLWLGMSLPQVVEHHDTVVQVAAWGVPFLAQVLALIVMLYKWSILKKTFTRFGRLLSEHIEKEKSRQTNEKNSNKLDDDHLTYLPK